MNIFYKFLCFYTSWAFIVHILYFFKLIKNTFIIALYTLIMSIFFSHIYPNYYTKYKKYKNIIKYILISDIIFHYLPVFVIPIDFNNMDYFYILTIVYIILFNVMIFKIYRDPYYYIYGHELD